MRTVTAFVAGVAAVGIPLYVAAVALAVGVGAAGDSLRIAVGPLVLVAVETSGEATATTFGAALPLAALAGGILNALVAAHLARRRRAADTVDSS